MDWNIMWIFTGGIALLLMLINLIRTLLGRRSGWQQLLFGSMAFGMLTVLVEYGMVEQWLYWGEMTALRNAVPAVYRTLCIAVTAGLAGNLLILILNLRREKQLQKDEA